MKIGTNEVFLSRCKIGKTWTDIRQETSHLFYYSVHEIFPILDISKSIQAV